jgi:hypothetical protein
MYFNKSCESSVRKNSDKNDEVQVPGRRFSIKFFFFILIYRAFIPHLSKTI